MAKTGSKNTLKINRSIVDLLESALKSARLTNCAVDPATQEMMRLYLDSWVAGPLAEALTKITGEMHSGDIATKVTVRECPKLRRTLVRFISLVGKEPPPPEWQTRPCGASLDTHAELTRGLCDACAAGCKTPENYPADEAQPAA